MSRLSMIKSVASTILARFGLEISRRKEPAVSSLAVGKVSLSLINTMPKSGSIYLTRSLAKVLPQISFDHPYISANSGFPSDCIVKDKIEHLIHSNARMHHLIQEHVGFSLVNVRLIETYIGKMVLHIRDPREAVLSWSHHVENNLRNDLLALYNVDVDYSSVYTKSTLEEKILYDFEHLFPLYVDWLRSWLSFYDDPSRKLPILLTTNSELRDNPAKLLSDIASFLGLGQIDLGLLEPAKQGQLHFRAGKRDEFAGILPSDVAKNCELLMDGQWFERFGWSRIVSF